MTEMKYLILSALFSTALFCADSVVTKKAVFGCKTGEVKAFERILDSIRHLTSYYDKNGQKYDVVLIAQSECVKFMLDNTDGTEYAKEEIPMDVELKLEKLKGKVRYEQCAVTLDRKGIPVSKIRKNVVVIPSATVSTVDYQLAGYAFIY